MATIDTLGVPAVAESDAENYIVAGGNRRLKLYCTQPGRWYEDTRNDG